MNRALKRKQERDTFTEKTGKLIRVASEILKSTVLSTVTSLLTGFQYLAQLYFGSEKLDKTLINWYFALLLWQVCNAWSIIVLQTTNISKLEMQKINGKPLRVQLTALFGFSLIFRDFIIETSKTYLIIRLGQQFREGSGLEQLLRDQNVEGPALDKVLEN